MSTPNFRGMTAEQFKAYQPRTEGEIEAYEEECKFRDWCNENEEDPQDPGALDQFNEIKAEGGDQFWEDLDENDRAGWEDNMNKD